MLLMSNRIIDPNYLGICPVQKERMLHSGKAICLMHPGVSGEVRHWIAWESKQLCPLPVGVVEESVCARIPSVLEADADEVIKAFGEIKK